MSGITDINIILKTLEPELHDGQYVYCTVSSTGKVNARDIIAMFKEKEAITLVLEKNNADALELTYTSVFAWITLTVHSSLTAVGLTAAFATALSDASISCNVIAAFYHDHIFVNFDDAEKAMSVLRKLSTER